VLGNLVTTLDDRRASEICTTHATEINVYALVFAATRRRVRRSNKSACRSIEKDYEGNHIAFRARSRPEEVLSSCLGFACRRDCACLLFLIVVNFPVRARSLHDPYPRCPRAPPICLDTLLTHYHAHFPALTSRIMHGRAIKKKKTILRNSILMVFLPRAAVERGKSPVMPLSDAGFGRIRCPDDALA